MEPGMEFGLLGPLLVRCGGADAPVPRGKQRVLLSVLLLNAGQVVPVLTEPGALGRSQVERPGTGLAPDDLCSLGPGTERYAGSVRAETCRPGAW